MFLAAGLAGYDATVRLTPWEDERLQIFTAAELARRHRAAGLLLNAPEAIALMCDAMLEAARAGRSYAEVEAAGVAAVDPGEVIAGVRELVEDVRLEVLLDDGPRLIVLVDPLGRGAPLAADGPGAIRAPDDDAPDDEASAGEAPADGSGDAGWMLASSGRARLELEVRNTSRRVVRVSSHYPFERVNPRLEFDRSAAAGHRLDIPAGSSERWLPGEARRVRLVRATDAS